MVDAFSQTRPLRVVNTLFARSKGGLEQVFLDYGAAFAQAGHDVHMICDPEIPYRAQLEATNLPIHYLTNFGQWDIAAALRLWRLIARIAPDVVIGHGNRSLSLLTTPLPRMLGGAHVPVMGVAENYKLKRFKRLDGAYTATKALKKEVEAVGLAPEKVFYCPNMIALPDHVHHAQRGHTPPVIGALGRFVAKKAFGDFIAALGILHERGVAFVAKLAGDGEEAEALRQQVAILGIADKVEFVGWVEDKSAFYSTLDVFCLPSTHEPFGIVLLEAMAHRLPIVSADAEGPSEFLIHGKDALVVPMRSPDAMADALQQLLEHKEQSDMMAGAALQSVQTQFSIEAVAPQLVQAAEAICSAVSAKKSVAS